MPHTRAARELQIVDPVLSNLARSFRPSGFIYDRLFPTVDVELDSGLYPIFDDAYWFGDDVDNKVSDRAETPEVDFRWSTEGYLCEDYRLKATITKKERRQAHQALKLERNKVEFVLTRMAMRRERRGAALLRHTSNGGQLTGGHATPGAKWNTDAATIELDVKNAKVGVYQQTGMVPNTIVIPYLVACEIALQQDIREIVKYTVNGLQVIGEGEAILPKKLWGLEVVVPQGAMVNTAKEGAAMSLSEIYADHVRVLYVAPGGGGWGIPSTAYSFKAEAEVVDRWKDNDPPVENLRAWECVDEKVCAPQLGYEISDVL
jgi:hypothetical protein